MISTSPAPIIDLIEAFRRSKTMFVAVSLGIFDRLQQGPADLAALAQHTGVNADALERLLDGCVGLGLLDRATGAYVNTPVAETYLCRDSPESLTGYILYSETVLYPLWANLEDAIREGTHRWQQTFGLEGAIFSHFFRTEEDTRTFL